MDNHLPNPDQIDRLRRATRQEIEQGISREIASIENERKAAVMRAQTLEHECARLAEENSMLKERLTPIEEIERRNFERVYSHHAMTFAGAEIYPADLAAKRTEHGYEGPEDGYLNWAWRGWMWRASIWENKHD